MTERDWQFGRFEKNFTSIVRDSEVVRLKDEKITISITTIDRSGRIRFSPQKQRPFRRREITIIGIYRIKKKKKTQNNIYWIYLLSAIWRPTAPHTQLIILIIIERLLLFMWEQYHKSMFMVYIKMELIRYIHQYIYTNKQMTNKPTEHIYSENLHFITFNFGIFRMQTSLKSIYLFIDNQFQGFKTISPSPYIILNFPHMKKMRMIRVKRQRLDLMNHHRSTILRMFKR